MIYLASPYTDKDPTVQEYRFEEACRAVAFLMWGQVAGNAGGSWFAFSPVAHCHPVAKYGLPRSFDYWKVYNQELLGACNELFVLRLPGWELSKGVMVEITWANGVGMPIRPLDPMPDGSYRLGPPGSL